MSPATPPTPTTPTTILTRQIKDYALEIGYSKVGITTADDFTQFADILTARGDAYDFWTHGPLKPLENAHIREAQPFARSIIVLIYDFARTSFPPELCALMGRVYQSRSYFSPPTNINGARLELMKQFLADKNVRSDNNLWIPQRWAAARAGVTTFGKNCCAYAGDDIGSFIVINTLIVDAELDYDTPTYESLCPANCHRCIDACPTKALYAPYTIDPRRCVGFLNWMTVSGRGFGTTEKIPLDLRPLMAQRIHGCDACQEACPRNRKKLTAPLPPDSFLEEVKASLTLENLLHMPAGFYETRVRPLMYNYIRDHRIFQRNAAVAIGNTHDPRYLPHLAQELDNSSEMIRAHVAWALGQLQSGEANALLQKHLADGEGRVGARGNRPRAGSALRHSSRTKDKKGPSD